MKLSEISELLHTRVLCNKDLLSTEVENGFASDLLSDVLTIPVHNTMLITGLSNIQVLRTAEILDIRAIILVRNKQASDEMIEMAQRCGIVLMTYSGSMFKACGILYSNGLKPVY